MCVIFVYACVETPKHDAFLYIETLAGNPIISEVRLENQSTPVPPKFLKTATAFIQKHVLVRKSVPFTTGPNGMNSLKKLVVSFRVLGYFWWILAIRTIFANVLMPQITTRWWFQILFIFLPIWEGFPFWLSLARVVFFHPTLGNPDHQTPSHGVGSMVSIISPEQDCLAWHILVDRLIPWTPLRVDRGILPVGPTKSLTCSPGDLRVAKICTCYLHMIYSNICFKHMKMIHT